MFCKNHGERSGINTCSKCGEWLCSECSVEVDGRIICKTCITRAIGGGRYKKVDAPASGRHISWFLLFIFSFILPGINYMYMGLIKRGLFAMSATMLSVYLGSLLNAPAFAIIIAMIWITSIFDGFQIRRRLMAGEVINDDVDDVMVAIKKNKNLILIGVVFIGGISLLQGVEHLLWEIGFPYGSISKLAPLAILGYGFYALTRTRKPAESKSKKASDDFYEEQN